MLLWTIVLVFVLCFLIYQWWFQSSRFRTMPEVTKAKVKAFNRPWAWMLYSIIVFLGILALIGYQIMVLFGYILEMQN